MSPLKALAALALLATRHSDLPAVHIDTPRGGWTAQAVSPISGTLADRHTPSVLLSVNGVGRRVNARDGHFSARLPLRPGPNQIEASTPAGRDQVTVDSSAPPLDLQVLLTWDSDGTDLDLHVTEPSGEECYHGNRRTAAGGVLEVDDTDGFGPEIYVLPEAPVGPYRVAVACFDADRSAITEATVEVVVRGGTPHERRYRFPLAFTHANETIEVGTVFLERAQP